MGPVNPAGSSAAHGTPACEQPRLSAVHHQIHHIIPQKCLSLTKHHTADGFKGNKGLSLVRRISRQSLVSRSSHITKACPDRRGIQAKGRCKRHSVLRVNLKGCCFMSNHFTRSFSSDQPLLVPWTAGALQGY